MFESDTIAAVSTAMQTSGIGIIRVSGPDAIKTADRIFQSPSGKRLADQPGYTMHYGWAVDGGHEIDEALFSVLRKPHSYTGEDTVEINCHGGMLSLQKVLEAVLHAGARPAEPGEFSRRAFMNGRMDLSQAEAVMNLIQAGNEHALRNSLRQLQGGLSEKIRSIRKSLLHETAYIEAALDDPEHIEMQDYMETLRETVVQNREAVLRLLETADAGMMLQEGIRTVIVGKPNAGKSSLLNMLAREEKAIVTEIAGTTRDVLEEHVRLGDLTLLLIDTAGIRDAADRIEQIGVARAKAQIRDADLILCVLDGSVSLDENDLEILRLIRGKKAIVIVNKSDLTQALPEESLKKALHELHSREKPIVITMSAKEQTGEKELEKAVRDLFFAGALSGNDEIMISGQRHKRALEEAAESLRLVLDSIDAGMPEDFLSIDLCGACDALGRITGETLSEDLVNEIFSSFCMGK